MAAAGAEATLSTVLGDDPLKDFALERLAAAGVRCHAIIDPTRPTVNKNAVAANGYQLRKIDTHVNSPISDNGLRDLLQAIRDAPADAVVFSDCRHGVFTRRSMPQLSEAIPPGRYRVG